MKTSDDVNADNAKRKLEADAIVVKSALDFALVELKLSLDEFVWSYVNGDDPCVMGYESHPICERKDFYDHYQKYRKMEILFQYGINAGWGDSFDWHRAKDLGWLSRHDEETFAEFLKKSK